MTNNLLMRVSNPAYCPVFGAIRLLNEMGFNIDSQILLWVRNQKIKAELLEEMLCSHGMNNGFRIVMHPDPVDPVRREIT